MNKNIAYRLKTAGIGNYLFEAKIIEEHAKKYNLCSIDLENMINRRTNREPLQYILGEWEFYGDVYKLNKDCLIPRPETEFLTEYIINNAEKDSVILDLCCGSGCISISALKRRKDLTAVLADISQGAINMANENSEINRVSDRLQSYCLDILQEHSEIMSLNLNIGMIVSNPPYLNKSEVEQIKLEKTELYHEPERAFFGGDDGLDFYRFIIDNYSRFFNVTTVFEAGISQSYNIIKMFEQINFSCEIIRDYNKIERVIIGESRARRKTELNKSYVLDVR